MVVSRKTKKKAFRGLTVFVIIPLLLINTYAFWELYTIANQTHMVLFGSITDSLTQLAIILGINNLVIIILLMYISAKK